MSAKPNVLPDPQSELDAVQQENDSVPLTSSKPTPETAPKGASNRRIVPLCDANDVSNPKVTYTYEMKNGWICRVPIKKSPETDFGLKLSDCQPPSKRRKKASSSIAPYKEQRFPCPDCEKWYGSDQKKIQKSCRHRVRSETKEELKMWDIGFPEDYPEP